MKPSKYISHIARTNIIKKKQRTWLSLTAICLSTAIIFTSMILFKNVYSFSKNTDYEAIGNYHYAALIEEPENLAFPSRYSVTLDQNTDFYGTYDQQTINLRSLYFDGEDDSILPFVIKTGTYPTNEHEILVSDQWNKQVGDEITLSLGELSYQKNPDNLYHFSTNMDFSAISHIQTFTFKVVGVYIENENHLVSTNGISLCYTLLPSHQESVLYVKDSQIQMSDSFTYFLEKMDIDQRYAYTNTDVVSNDSINNYLQDTTVILAMFVIIAAIAIAMSLISVHNVVLISDKDRKKELGLLKSIGATPHEIKKLLQIELSILGILGALLGLALGLIVAYFVLNLFIEKIYVTFHLTMILDPLILMFSFVAGILLMYISGMKAYRHYIFSSAIEDLKDFSYEYGTPEKPKTTRRKSFEWKMFIIYNGRMKKQTRNIFYSFTLFLATTVLFISIFLSNMIYVNKYVSKGYDFDVTNYQSTLSVDGGLREVDPAVSLAIYQKEAENKINANYIYAERLMISGSFWTKDDAYNSTLIDSYNAISSIGISHEEDPQGEIYCNIYQYPTAFDSQQLEALRPYIQSGSIDHLTSEDVVAIFSSSDRLGAELCNNFHVGDIVAYGSEKDLSQKKTIAAIAVIPDTASHEIHFDLENYPRVFAFSMDALIESGQGKDISEHICIDLLNASTAGAVQDELETILIETDNQDTYILDSVAITVETNRFATFIIEALLYPLFFMLFIVSLMNINNVFVGNVHLKRNDISIMKSVGMTGSQLNMLFTLEYVEGYLNAAALVAAIFIPVAIIESHIGIASSFDFGANIFGTLLIALFVLGVMLVAPLVVLTLRRIRKILPIENLKDVD